MELYSYVITHDSGFAPNPFGGFLTLATCKPQIRKSAQISDWIMGTGSVSTVGNNKLVYAGRISKILSIDEYGNLPEYNIKRPKKNGEWWEKHGDNIYYKKSDGNWKQRTNRHHVCENIKKDVSGLFVLICDEFWYFGESAIEIPRELVDIIKKGPGHKKISKLDIIRKFIRLLSMDYGIHGRPEMENITKRGAGGRSPHLTFNCL